MQQLAPNGAAVVDVVVLTVTPISYMDVGIIAVTVLAVWNFNLPAMRAAFKLTENQPGRKAVLVGRAAGGAELRVVVDASRPVVSMLLQGGCRVTLLGVSGAIL
jgi:hypothetical protein